MMRLGGFLVALLAPALAACVNYALVDPGRTTVRGELSVASTIAWNKQRKIMLPDDEIVLSNPAVEVWTQDGTEVDQLVFYVGVEDGEPLMRGRISRDLPRFRRDMSASEVAELFEATLVGGLGAIGLERRELKPARFAGGEGFRLRLGFTLDDEVERELVATGTVREGKLYLIAWLGTRLYHFEHYLPEFEVIAASARINF